MTDEPPFSVRCEPHHGGVVVVVTGEVDLSTSPAVREQLRAPEARAETVVLDLREVTFMDSSGLGVIGVERILALAQLTQVLEIVQSPGDVLPG